MKKILALLLALILCLGLCGCGGVTQWQDGGVNATLVNTEYFESEVVEKIASGNYIIRDKHTNVLYLVVSGPSSCAITPIFNPDGTLKLYEE